MAEILESSHGDEGLSQYQSFHNFPLFMPSAVSAMEMLARPKKGQVVVFIEDKGDKMFKSRTEGRT